MVIALPGFIVPAQAGIQRGDGIAPGVHLAKDLSFWSLGQDENKKTLIAGALRAKNQNLYGDLFNRVMGGLDINALEPRVRTIIKPLLDRGLSR